eukprot:CAMPEP_0114251714 /NCGR_PEP_ID=MMETSP0058-20121206/15424_1 /TAXON_ID=36894 /ORGANISM="Pyramimonas parkeae, CCMP726" /LENGTH=635 /DNA_ID=CAMNT_0001365547 /DNA_START=9 /DNA_END=1913 /DNA_ORIENTATION=+
METVPCVEGCKVSNDEDPWTIFRSALLRCSFREAEETLRTVLADAQVEPITRARALLHLAEVAFGRWIVTNSIPNSQEVLMRVATVQHACAAAKEALTTVPKVDSGSVMEQSNEKDPTNGATDTNHLGIMGWARGLWHRSSREVPSSNQSGTLISNPEQATVVAFLAQAGLLQGTVLLVQEDYVRAGLALRTSLNHLRSLPDHSTSGPISQSLRHFGLGVITLFVARAPDSVLTLVHLFAGLTGDVESAMQELRWCSQGDGAMSTFADIVQIAQLLASSTRMHEVVEPSKDVQAADDIVVSALLRYPAAVPLIWAKAAVCAARFQHDEQRRLLEKVKTIVDQEFAESEIKAHRVGVELGYLHLTRGEWALAAEHLLPLACEPAGRYAGQAMARLLLGVVRAAEGQMEEARRVFARVADAAAESSGAVDKHIAAKARGYLRRQEGRLLRYEVQATRGGLTNMDDAWLQQSCAQLQEVLVSIEERAETCRQQQWQLLCSNEGADAMRATKAEPLDLFSTSRNEQNLALAEELSIAKEEKQVCQLLLGSMLNARDDPFGAEMYLDMVLDDIHDECSTSANFNVVPTFNERQVELVLTALHQRATSLIKQHQWNKALSTLDTMKKPMYSRHFPFDELLW